MTLVAVPIAGLLTLGALLVFFGPAPYFPLGNILIGAGLALGATFATENWKRRRERDDLAAALYYELANRVARCCIDFDDPWSGYLEKPRSMSRFRVGKFLPEPMTIFNANANKLSLFPVGMPAALMGFYFRLWTVSRDIGLAREEAEAVEEADDVVARGTVQLIGRRFAATLQPGRDALEALASLVPQSAVIESAALQTLDPKRLRFDGSLRDFLNRTVERADEIRRRVDAKTA